MTVGAEVARAGGPAGFVDRLTARVVLPHDDEDERIRKTTLMRIAVIVLVVLSSVVGAVHRRRGGKAGFVEMTKQLAED
jgi:hypothetical protein